MQLRDVLFAWLGVSLVACGGDDEVTPTPEPTHASVVTGVASPNAEPMVPSAPQLTPLPTPPSGAAGVIARAFDGLLAAPFCEEGYCVDPFPIHAVEHVDHVGERVVISGLGGWVGLFENDAWRFVRAPEGIFVHDAAFAPEGGVYAVGDANALLVLEGSALRVLGQTNRRGLRSVHTAVLPVAPDEIWVGSMFGRVARWDGQRFVDAPGTGTPRTTIEAMMKHDGALVAQGDLATGVLVSNAWQDATTRDQWREVGERNGCWTRDISDESLADATTAQARPYGGTLPAMPDRSLQGLIPALDPARAELLRALIEIPPYMSTLSRAHEGADWVRVVRDGSVSLQLTARIEGRVHVMRDMPRNVVGASIANGVVFMVTSEHQLIRVTAAAFTDAAARTTTELEADARPSDVLAVRADEAWVLTRAGDVLRVRGSDVSREHRAAHPMNAMGGHAHEAIAVGQGGAVARFDGAVWQDLTPITHADLFQVRGTSTRSVASGDVGTVIVFDAGVPRLLPRFTDGPLADAWAEGEWVFAVTDRNELFRWDGDTWSAFTRAPGRREAALVMGAWAPPASDAEAWRAVPSITIDAALEQGVAPTSVWMHPLPRRLLEGVAPLTLGLRDRREEMLHYETNYCCDPRGDSSDVMSSLEFCTAASPCGHILAHPAIGYDAARNELLRAVPISSADASDDARCTPLRLEMVAMRTGVVTPGAELPCGDARATWRELHRLRRFVSWSYGESEDETGVLAIHRTPDEDQLVSVAADLRTFTVRATLPRLERDANTRIVESWGVVNDQYVSPDERWAYLSARFRDEALVWMAPLPAGLHASSPCTTIRITDDDGATNVRAAPGTVAPVTGTLSNGATSAVVERRGRWVHIASPDGWVFDRNVHCE